MPSTTFEVGDRVRVEDPGDKNHYHAHGPHWPAPMDDTVGKEGEVIDTGSHPDRVSVSIGGGGTWTYRTYHLTNLTKEQTATNTINPDQARSVADMRNGSHQAREAMDSMKGPLHVVVLTGRHTPGRVYKVRGYRPDSDGDLDVRGPGPSYVKAHDVAPCDSEGRLLEWGLTVTDKAVTANTAKVYVKATPEDTDAKPYAGKVYPLLDKTPSMARIKTMDGTALVVRRSDLVLVEGNWDDAPAA